jgi:hypothetical protein
MSEELRRLLLNRRFLPEEQNRLFGEVQEGVLEASAQLAGPDFGGFQVSDLQTMFDLYDRKMLNGVLRETLQGRPLRFSLSGRLTRSGGRTTWKITRNRRSGNTTEEFEIAVSSHLLSQSFQNGYRPIRVTGLDCHNRLQAMQRIMEHEIVHLAERLAWQTSSCRRSRFQSIAGRLFGHREHTHDLVTTAEVALEQLGIRRGSRVAFDIDGSRRVGIVNRLTRRATVLVPDASGMLYSDGCRYQKYYVPLSLLQNLSSQK